MIARATWLLILKRLFTSASTYRLIGVLLVALGFANGSTVMGYVETLVCVAIGGCT